MESQEHIFMINSSVERTRGNRAINTAEDENYGEILKSGDNTLLRYKIFDGDGEILPLEGLPCESVIKKEDKVVYRTPAEIDAENIVSFKIDEVLPSDRNNPYTIEFIITNDQDTLIFPSDDRINLYIYPSSLSADGDIINQTPEARLNEIVIVAVNDATQDIYLEVDNIRETLESEFEANEADRQQEFEANESNRQENETIRQSQEESREIAETARQEGYDDLVDTGVMQENINQKLAESEAEYAPRLTELEQNDADLTAQLAQTAMKLDGSISAKEFGAVGDWDVFRGIGNDDTDALQNTFNAADGIVELEPNKVYNISNTLVIDISKVRGLKGNNATVHLSGDFVGIRFVGTTTSTSAHPGSTRGEIFHHEMNAFCENLKITSALTMTGLKGVGVEFEGTFAFNFRNNHLYNLGTGIRFRGTNRNIIIATNNIYHCKDYGIHYDGGNLHQQNIIGNHISYCRKCVFLDDPEMHNMQFIGNDVETSSTPELVEEVIHFKSRDNSLQSIMISGNTIESHLNSEAILHIDSIRVRRCQDITITGNQFGNSLGNDIRLSNVMRITITGNVFKRARGASILSNGQLETMVLSSNTFSSDTMFKHTNGNLSGVIINGNAWEGFDKPFSINAETVNVYSLSVTNNTFRPVSVRDARFDDDRLGFMFDIYVRTLEHAVIKNNTIRGRDYFESGMRVEAIYHPINYSVISENIVSHMSDRVVFEFGQMAKRSLLGNNIGEA